MFSKHKFKNVSKFNINQRIKLVDKMFTVSELAKELRERAGSKPLWKGPRAFESKSLSLRRNISI